MTHILGSEDDEEHFDVLFYQGKTRHGTISFENTTVTREDIGSVIYWGLFSYMGWNALNSVASEMKNPTRELKKALRTSIIFLTILYTLMTLAIYLISTKDEIKNDDAYSLSFSTKFFGPQIGYSVTMFGILCSIFSSFNGFIIIARRMIASAAEDGQLPSIFYMLQIKGRSPKPAVLTITSFTLLFALIEFITLSRQTTRDAMLYVSLIEILGTAITCFCVVVLRKTKPKWDRPLKISIIYPFLFLFVAIAVLGTSVNTIYGIALMSTSVPVYFTLKLLKMKRKMG